jgi:hypothetical protein
MIFYDGKVSSLSHVSFMPFLVIILEDPDMFSSISPKSALNGNLIFYTTKFNINSNLSELNDISKGKNFRNQGNLTKMELIFIYSSFCFDSYFDIISVFCFE